MKKYINYINERQWWMNKDISKNQLFINKFKYYKLGESVVFRPENKIKVNYTVGRICIECDYDNDIILNILNINNNDKKIFCEKSYGYCANFTRGNIPTYLSYDIDAANRLIHNLQERCEDVKLDKDYYNIGDCVTFIINTDSYFVYEVGSKYLYLKNSTEGIGIFQHLNIKDYLDFCSKSYGYQCEPGYFPEYERMDIEAANRVIKDIKEYIINYEKIFRLY